MLVPIVAILIKGGLDEAMVKFFGGVAPAFVGGEGVIRGGLPIVGTGEDHVG